MFAVIDMQELGVMLVAVFGAFGGLIGLVFKYMADREKAAREERQADRTLYREERKEDLTVYTKSLAMLGTTLEKNSKSNQDVANATKQAAKEAKERNGHLAELQLEGQKQNREFTEKIVSTVQNVKQQNVVTQTVEHSDVKEEIVANK